MGYLLFPVVLPWATCGYLLSYARCSRRVAQPLATFCSSLGYLLFGSQRSSFMGCPCKNCQNFSKYDVCLVFISFSLASFVFRNYSCHQTLGYWLPIVSYCLTMGYVWPPIVICQMQPKGSPTFGYLLFLLGLPNVC